MSTASATESSVQTAPAALLYQDNPELLAHPVPRVTRMDNGAVACHVRGEHIHISSDPLSRSGATVRMAIHDARDFEHLDAVWCQTYHRIPLQSAPRFAGFLIERPEPICHRLARTIASYVDAQSALEARPVERQAPSSEVTAAYERDADAARLQAILAVVKAPAPALQPVTIQAPMLPPDSTYAGADAQSALEARPATAPPSALDVAAAQQREGEPAHLQSIASSVDAPASQPSVPPTPVIAPISSAASAVRPGLQLTLFQIFGIRSPNDG